MGVMKAPVKVSDLYNKYRDRTMCVEPVFWANIELAERARSVPGSIVECGVWAGGMIVAMAEILGQQRSYFLCDSFEGLPPAKDIDGPAALAWQAQSKDNCKIAEHHANNAMIEAGVWDSKIVKGWFSDTLHKLDTGPIALLRLDADWYESTKICLHALYDKVVVGGIIIIDDYYVWDGCAKAVHEFLYHYGFERIQALDNVAYMVKR
jgi:O-methyltransferase